MFCFYLYIPSVRVKKNGFNQKTTSKLIKV